MMKLAFIGIGNVGFAIANNLQKKGFEIIIAHNNSNSESVQNALTKNPNFNVQNIQEAVYNSDIVFLATPFKVIEETIKNINFDNKTVIDCTNPIGIGMSHALNSSISGSEKIQQWLPNATVIKAFTIYGFENLENSDYSKYVVKPVMMIAGNDLEVKQNLNPIIEAMGFEMLDTGKLDQALHLEHMTLLWIKMVRRDGHSANMVWAMLKK
jgi:8-hydroxy-5-deazaflavin:NADPH oxidoreductase